MKDFFTLKAGSEYCKLFLRKSHDISPFEDIGPLESLSFKTDCSLFALGTHQKKRPDNLVLGRLYSGRILDMFEFQVKDYKPIQ